jgi:hypothetical protein
VAACNDTVVTACSGNTAATDSLRSACQSSEESWCNAALPAGYAETHAQACLTAVGTAYADARLTAAEAAVVRDFGAPCDQLIKGPVANGGACAKDLDCDTVSGSVCIVKGTSSNCGVPTVVNAGMSCAASDAVCDDGFYCDAGMHCVAQQAAGQACTMDAECSGGFVCTNLACTAKTSASMCMLDSDCTPDKTCQIATGSTTGGACVTQVILSPTDAACQDLQ